MNEKNTKRKYVIYYDCNANQWKMRSEDDDGQGDGIWSWFGIRITTIQVATPKRKSRGENARQFLAGFREDFQRNTFCYVMLTILYIACMRYYFGFFQHEHEPTKRLQNDLKVSASEILKQLLPILYSDHSFIGTENVSSILYE